METNHEQEHQEHARQQGCCHYWIIESAIGPVSKGVCKLCSAQSEFRNYISDYLGENTEEHPELCLAAGVSEKEVKESEEHALLHLRPTATGPFMERFPKGKHYRGQRREPALLAWHGVARGLALKTTLVEPHGGRISVESQDGEGRSVRLLGAFGDCRLWKKEH